MTALPTLRPYQVEAGRAIVDSVVNGRELSFTVVMARQSGKNELSAQIELFLLLRNARFKIDAIKAAPTFRPRCEMSIDRLWEHAACLEGVSFRQAGHIIRLGQAYARFVEAERRRLGENHPLFLTQYELKTVRGAGRLFSGAQRAQLAGTHGRQHAPIANETYVAGLDIGGGQGDGREHDASVLTIARAVYPAWDAVVRYPRLEVVEQIAFTSVPHDDELFARLADVLGRVWRVRQMIVDSTGIGETLAQMLARVVRPLKLTSESKSIIGYELIAAANSGRLRMYAADGSAEHAECWRQLELARVAYRPSQQMNFYVDPTEGHDDYLVSLALAAHAGSEGVPEPRIARGRIPVPSLN